ncbi:MAG TPA: hypothetical protein VGQ41_22720 [Pyrinomonadaceae bacterium]|jgi:hypothetical protein|nr:hypothetical protein [Pyrinomonadaceae bacterium]
MRNKKQVIARMVTDAQWREVDRYRIKREFDPDVMRRLKGDARRDITVNVPKLAAHALRAGLVERASNVRRCRKTVLPGSCAVEAGIG